MTDRILSGMRGFLRLAVRSQKSPAVLYCNQFSISHSNSIRMTTANSTVFTKHDLSYIFIFQVYEQIAGHFSTTRHKPWPKVVEFMQGVPPGSVVMDLGCGNGKNILRRNDIVQVCLMRISSLLTYNWES